MVQLRTPAALEIALHRSSLQPIAIFRQRLGVKRDSMVSGLKATAETTPTVTAAFYPVGDSWGTI